MELGNSLSISSVCLFGWVELEIFSLMRIVTLFDISLLIHSCCLIDYFILHFLDYLTIISYQVIMPLVVNSAILAILFYIWFPL